MIASSSYRILGTVLLIAVLSGILIGAGSASASGDITNKPDNLESIHGGMVGSGTPTDPYQVSNLSELQAVTVDLESHYLLVDDIDARPTGMWDGGEGFEPIGGGNFGPFPMNDSRQESLGFRGHFDGNNKEISGLKIDRDRNDVGLFAGIGKGGSVKNLTVRKADVSASARVGVVAGTIVQGDIHGVDVIDSQTSSKNGQIQGGVVGIAYNNTRLERVTFAGEASSNGVAMGGIVGWISNESRIHQCRVDVEMSGKGDLGLMKNQGAGGVAGIVSNTTISQCGAVVDIDAPSQERVGGLVGFAPPVGNQTDLFDVSVPTIYGGLVIKDSYVEGQIGGDYSVGGLAGSIIVDSRSVDVYTLETAYIAANVTSDSDGSNRDGVVCGIYDINYGCVQEEHNTYYDQDYEGVQPLHDGADPTPLHGYEIRGDAAEDNLDGFDFEAVWSTTNSPWLDYPHLRWEDRPHDVDGPLDLSWRFFELAKVIGEHLALLGSAGGLLGLLISHGRPTIKRRSVGLIIGSVVGLLTITIVGTIFEAISWIMTGETVPQAGTLMLPPILEERDVYYDVMPIMSALSQISVTIGAASMSIGSGLWAVSSQGSSLWTTSRRSIFVGIALMTLSVGGRLFTVAAVVVLGSVG